MEIREPQFTTTSVYLAAFLRMRGFPLALNNRAGLVVFAFISTPSLEKMISDFNSNAFVQVAAFTSAVKIVKAEMRKMIKAPSSPSLRQR